jgi:hypothetical protein
MGPDQGIYTWVSVSVMRKSWRGVVLGRLWIFFLGGRGRGRRNSRASTTESFSQDDTRFRTSLFMLYIIYWVVGVSLQDPVHPDEERLPEYPGSHEKFGVKVTLRCNKTKSFSILDQICDPPDLQVLPYTERVVLMDRPSTYCRLFLHPRNNLIDQSLHGHEVSFWSTPGRTFRVSIFMLSQHAPQLDTFQ